MKHACPTSCTSDSASNSSKHQEPVLLTADTRVKLPDERQSISHTFSIQEEKEAFRVTIILSVYPSGRVGEVFVKGHKSGSFEHGALDALGRAVSVALQYGVPLHAFVAAWKYSTFSPKGFVKQGCVSRTSSVLDYISKYIEMKCPDGFLRPESSSKHVQEPIQEMDASKRPTRKHLVLTGEPDLAVAR